MIYQVEPTEDKYLLHRRFDRFARLFGDEAMKKLFSTHVMIIGVGGVGSWAAESLMRSGIGKISLVDFDEICTTNTNRQLHAMTGMIGKKKVDVMAERLKKINPQAQINAIKLFYNSDNSKEILSLEPDYIIDAIDNITAKCHLLNSCREKSIPVFCSGGAAGRTDPLSIRFSDLSESHSDPFLSQLRKELRVDYAWPREGLMNVPTVFSEEPLRDPVELNYDEGMGFRCVCPQGQNDFHSCQKRNVIRGTASYVTGAFGLVIASKLVDRILNNKQQGSKS